MRLLLLPLLLVFAIPALLCAQTDQPNKENLPVATIRKPPPKDGEPPATDEEGATQKAEEPAVEVKEIEKELGPIERYLQANSQRARDLAVAELEALGAASLPRFKELLDLQARTLPEQAGEAAGVFPIESIEGLALVQVPAAATLAADSPGCPLLVVLLPSVLDDAEAGEEFARLIGGTFQDAGWVVAAPRPFKLDDNLTFRVDRTRPAFQRWVGGSAELVPWLVAHLLRALPIDPDRVHVLGFGDGGDGALWAAARFADRLASVTAIDARLSGRNPTHWGTNLRQLDVLLGYGIYERDWQPSEQGALEKLLASMSVNPDFFVIQEHTDRKTVFPAEELITDLSPRRRAASDRVVRWFTDRPGFGSCQWVEILSCGNGAYVEVECDRASNTISIRRASDVGELLLHLDPLLLDPTLPVVVRDKSGILLVAEPKPEVANLLECWRRSGDPGRLYSQQIEVRRR